MSLYPNPLIGDNAHATIIYNFEKSYNVAALMVFDLAGKLVHKDQLSQHSGLHQYHLQKQLPAGIYVVSVITDAGRIQQKLIVQ